MPFKQDAFMKANFSPRTEKVGLPSLADWFDGDPEWEVRGLTGAELARCNAAQTKTKNLSNIIEALSSGTNAETVNALRQSLGLGDNTPGELAKRLEMLTLGSVDPVVPLELAVRLAEAYPVEFFQLTNTITKLTGMGHEAGKQGPSGSKTK